MDEREALKRQIELLQNLIDNHKSIHGDAPTGRVQQRMVEASTSTRAHGSSSVHPASSRMGPDAPQSCASWRKTYSLKNKNPQPSVRPPSVVSTSACSAVSGDVGRKEEAKSVASVREVNTGRRNTDALAKSKTDTALMEHAHQKGAIVSSAASSQHQVLLRGTQKRSPGEKEKQKKVPGAAPTSMSSQQLQAKALLISKTAGETEKAVNPSTSASVATPPAAPVAKSSKPPPCKPACRSSRDHVGAAFLRKSQFTWVKKRPDVGGAGEKQASRLSPSPVKAATASTSSAQASGGSVPVAAVGKKTPGRKSLRRRSPGAAAPKTSKYRWVSSSAGAQARSSRKWASPKPATPPAVKAEPLRKARAASRTPPSVSSRYRWKAACQSATLAAEGAAASRRRSSVWLRGGLAASSSSAQRTSHLPSSYSSSSSSSPGAFKLRSKMKIIRRSASSGCSPSAAKLPQRSRAHTSPLRRTPSRELVAFGRHKLRRLNTALPKTRAAASASSGSAHHHRTHLAHAHFYNPALTWRAKRIQSARSFLQNRQSLRTHHYKQPSPSQRWRGSSMCWIRGSLYRVSANKLSRTVGSSMSINRTGRPSSSGHSWAASPVLNRPSATRHLACRAVQRSLAIIRQAQQKKQPKQYCMYYNRFGKCNRGTSCPYIHDPDKVAVCTRFLRGTCKQADGTCPFSHKVAKEKMPVCSYFLRGICNNNDCPYSHVYVSHKAKVCDDFVKGYCPEGEKCKKKHTLECPDFLKTGSCPRRAHCKLQHHRGPKRHGGLSSSTPAKRARTKDPCRRPHLSVVVLQGSQATPETPTTKGPLELPSFISLSSSPEEADAPDAPGGDSPKVKEKKLQIKPRL
ncbi:uncharacterized protein zc3h3 [Nelusetta ayraudi]|uniref:uncharacterized protein zc3h3 n=1 Tax=Nelusetta ayraudi TaxID=303726 RepID=UPI003F705369